MGPDWIPESSATRRFPPRQYAAAPRFCLPPLAIMIAQLRDQDLVARLFVNDPVYLQACHCDYGCPCEFSAPPTAGSCHGVGLWKKKCSAKAEHRPAKRG